MRERIKEAERNETSTLEKIGQVTSFLCATISFAFVFIREVAYEKISF